MQNDALKAIEYVIWYHKKKYYLNASGFLEICKGSS